jgi:hypothetical protein
MGWGAALHNLPPGFRLASRSEPVAASWSVPHSDAAARCSTLVQNGKKGGASSRGHGRAVLMRRLTSLGCQPPYSHWVIVPNLL